MDKQLLTETISFVEKLSNSEEKYSLLRKLYLEDAGVNIMSSPTVKRVVVIQAFDEIIRRIFVGEMSIQSARNFSQTKEFNIMISTGNF